MRSRATTLVYRLARYRNLGGEVIPERVISRAPSAELRPNQKDTDFLPEYDELDPILEDWRDAFATPPTLLSLDFAQKTSALRR